MHAFAKTIIEEFELDPEPRDLRAVAELDHPLWVQTGLVTFRQWLGMPGASNTRRPSIDLLEVLFGRGRLALNALFRAYEATVPPAGIERRRAQRRRKDGETGLRPEVRRSVSRWKSWLRGRI